MNLKQRAGRLVFVAAFALIPFTAPAQESPAPATAPAATTAKELRVFDPSLIDHSVDPCQNFYQFACNNWLKKNPLPADQASYGHVSELSELNRTRLHTILEQATDSRARRTPEEQKTGDEFASCMDTATLEAKGTTPIQPILKKIDDLKSPAQLPALVAELELDGVNVFFNDGSNQDFDDSTKVILFWVADGLGLPERDYYLREDEKSKEQRKQYATHITNMFKLLGEPEAQAATDAQTVLELETRLAKATLKREDMRDPANINHPMRLVEFEKQVPNLGLPEFLKVMGAPAIDKINVEQPKLFAEVNSIYTDTDMATIRTYLRWHVLSAFAGTSSPASFDAENFNFYSRILNGQEKQQERWKRCTRRIDMEMGEALGKVYVAKYFPPEEKQRTLELTRDIEQAMDKDIDQLTWMGPETRTRAKEKLHTVVNKVGYPDKWRDYSSLKIVRGDAYGNHIRYIRYETARDLGKIGKPVDRGEWGMSPPTVNAEYNPQMNDVNFPAGYLQPPFFSAKEDSASNYGNMGSTIGHELTHGFDDEGRHFDAKGNLTDWWTKEDEEKFNQRADCVVQQFNAYEPVPGAHVNGKLTLGENIADLGGTLLAWVAWLERAKAENLDLSARQDGYTPDQRFWVAYAQQWCTQTRPESLRTQVLTDPHAPDEYRTNGILQDLPEFAKSFQCKQGTPMAPAKTCRVW